MVKVKERNLRREPAFAPRSNATKTDSTGWNPPEPVTVGWTDYGCNAGWEPGLVLDPFVGTGTTLLAAHQLGRRAIGIDASEDYLQQAVRRLTLGDAAVRRQVRTRRMGAEQGGLL